jgi:hypothetical protein
MIYRHALWIFLLLIIVVGAAAQTTTDNSVIAKNNLQSEITACRVYYAIVESCLPDSANAPTENDRKQSIETKQKLDIIVKNLSSKSAELGRSIGMTEEAMLSRLQMSLTEQQKILNASCVNLTTLYDRYGERCKVVNEDPESVLKEYLK